MTLNDTFKSNGRRTSLHNGFRPVFFVVALVIALVGLVPAFSQKALAGQVTSRGITMSSSTASASGTSYNVVFTPSAAQTIAGIAVDICDDTPIVGSTTCTLPAGFDWGGASPTLQVGYTGMGSGWTVAGIQAGDGAGKSQVLELSNVAAQSLTSATPVNFTITTVTNPSTANHSFYARITTYTTTANMATYTTSGTVRAANPTYYDYGGAALATGNPITVTAKVMEQITFCVETEATPGTVLTTCSGGGTAVNLGNTQGVLSSAGPYVDKTTEYLVSTNASHQVTVNVEGTSPYFAADTHYISALTTAHTSSPGVEQFGICTYGYAGYNSQFTAISAYNGTPAADCTGTAQTAGTGSTGGDNSATFYFGSNTTGTYGDSIATIAAGTTNIGIVPMLANIAVTTPAGVYTTSLQYIATGQY